MRYLSSTAPDSAFTITSPSSRPDATSDTTTAPYPAASPSAIFATSPSSADANHDADDAAAPQAEPATVAELPALVGVTLVVDAANAGTLTEAQLEAAGVVLAVGPGVTDLAAGDRVIYAGSYGAFAEQLGASADTLLPLSIAFLADDGTVVNIADMKPKTTESH